MWVCHRVNKASTTDARNGEGYGKEWNCGIWAFSEWSKAINSKKQYHVLRMINSETINLYWEIGEEIYR